MPLTIGSRLGSYEILAPLGAGGMGEVYRARDRKLNRDVALKVLPEQFALDEGRLARFKREAHVLASLNHPNIAAIYGLEEADGVRALVLEFVEGPTLADRIAQGPLPLDEALPIAKQIAEALEAALMVLALEAGRRAQPSSQGVNGSGRSATSDIRPLVQTTFDELNGEISPDSRWVAYQSNESGQDEIYVRPFPDTDSGRWQVSTGGGTRPLWARSGKELFYRGLSGAVMSASIEGGSPFRAGNPTRLFEGPYLMAVNFGGRTYDVSPDGQRFLMVKPGWSPRAGRRADEPHRRPKLVRGADAPRADELTGARQSFPEPRPRELLLCCGPSSSPVYKSFQFNQYPRIQLPTCCVPSSRGSGCAPWVR